MKLFIAIASLSLICMVSCGVSEEDQVDAIQREILKELKRNEIALRNDPEGVRAEEDFEGALDPDLEESAEEHNVEMPKKSPWGRRLFRRVRVRIRVRKAAKAIATCYKLGICG
eukprot:gene6987-12609_t